MRHFRHQYLLQMSGGGQKKTNFLVKIFQKNPKNGNLQNSVLIVFLDNLENQFGQSRKRSTIFLKKFAPRKNFGSVPEKGQMVYYQST